MSWEDDPVLKWGRNPKSPPDFPAESADEAQQRAGLAVGIMESERGEHPNPDTLEREIDRTKALAGPAAPAPSTASYAAPSPAPKPTWQQDEVAGSDQTAGGWQSDVKAASWWDTIKAIPGTLVGQLKQQAGGFMQALGESGILESDALKAGQLEAAGLPKEYALLPKEEQPYVKFISKKTGQSPAEVAENFEIDDPSTPVVERARSLFKEGEAMIKDYSPGELSFWKQAVLNGGTSVLSQAPFLAASIATGNPAIALGAAAATQGSQTYGEAREAGLSPGRSAAHASFDAVVEAGMELVPLKFMMDKAGGPVGHLILGTLFREVPTEVATTMLQSANAKLSTRPDMGWEEYWQDVLDTAGATLVSAPLLAGAAKAASPLAPKGALQGEAPTAQPGPSVADWQDNPIAVMSQSTDLGHINGELTSPNIDEPTNIMDTSTVDQVKQSLNAIDPEQLTEKEVNEAKRRLEEDRKQSKAPPLPAAEEAWSHIATAPTTAVEDAGELGASTKSVGNAANYVNPNTGERLDRTFLYGPEGFEGLTPRQVLPKPGTYTLGVPSEDRPAEYLRPLHDTIEQWRQEYLPNDTIVLSNEQLFSNSALGWHYSTDSNSHLIVPAVLRKPSRGLGQYNPNTIASAFYNATHEFGHALITSKFFEGVQNAQQVRDESRKGLVTSTEGLPEAQQAVVAEFNALKEQILSGQMNAQQFVERWMSPSKIGRANFLKDHKVAPEAPAKQLINAIVRRGVVNSNIRDEVSQTALKQRLNEDYLSLDEYLAEQMSRHAYKQQWDKTSPLGRWFGETLAKMRSFFVKTKKDGVIAPGVGFQQWVDGLSKTARADETTAVVKNRKEAGKKVQKPKAAKTALAGVKKPKVAKVAHNVQSDTYEREKAKANKLVDSLFKNGSINTETLKEMKALIDAAAWDELVDTIQRESTKNVNFELDVGENVEDQPDWKDGKFDSPMFKAWFGEWRDDPTSASVARVGVFRQQADGTLAVDRERDSPPLVLFASAERIQTGENTFHVGTLRGVEYAEAHHPQPPQDRSLVPVVLNMRNPYIVSDFQQAAPNRAELESQGHDGIVYQNDLEGDISFVVFRPNQVRVMQDRNPYGRNMQMELDYDSATPEGHGAGRLWQSIKNFVNEPGPTRRALRHVKGLIFQVSQMQQLAQLNPDLTDLTYLINTNTEYARYGSSRRADADRLLDKWKSHGKENIAKINRALIAEKESGENWFELVKDTKQREGQTVPWWKFQMSEKARAQLKTRGIDVDTENGRSLAGDILAVKNNLLDYLNEDEQVLQEVLGHRYAHSQARLNDAVKVLKSQVHQFRQTPFFPEGRFGNLVLTIAKQKLSGPGHEVVYREAFESRAKWEAAFKKAQAKATPDEQIRKHEVADSSYVLMSLPTDFLDITAAELGLTEAQVDSLTQVLQPVKQERLLSEFDKARLGVKGYSSDAMRSYANFTWHHSNAEAKLLYRRKFNGAIASMRQRLRASELDPRPQSLNEVARLTRVVRAMEGMRDYVMSPPNEMQNARAAVSVLYLAYNVKTALVNLYGLATVWSDLTSKFGAVDGEKRFVRASYRAASSLRLTDLNARKQGDYLPPDIQRGLDRAIEEGVLSQSYAYHLAGMAQANALRRLPLYEHSGKLTQGAVDLGMYPFRLMELATRRITFVAALEEELSKHKGEFNIAYENAVAQTNKLQNDYTLGNRPPIMRGGALKMGPVVPLATIFASFAQHMAFHGFGGYELGQRRALKQAISNGELDAKHDPKWYSWGYGYTARIWLLTLMVAGYAGLPGAENILDLISALWRQIGGKKPLRQELRELVQAVDENPEDWSRNLGTSMLSLEHGLTGNVAGFDISRSIGFGRIVPGTDTFARSSAADPEKAMGAATLDVLGPLGGVLKFGLQSYSAMTSQKTWKDAAKYTPGGLGNLVNAYIWSQEGVLGPDGGKITLERTPEGKLAPRDLTWPEIAGKALGFNPEIVARNREANFTSFDQKVYWQSKRTELIKANVRAREEGDGEAISDTKKAISDFNLDVSGEEWSRKLRVTGQDIGNAWKAHIRNKRLEESGQPKEKRYRGLYQDIRKSYETPESESSDK